MNTFTYVLVTIATVSMAEASAAKHPVREEIVEEIKLKATSWTPKEVGANHIRHRSVESIKASMGHLGTAPSSLGAEVFKKVTSGALDMFRQITSVFGGVSAEKE